jgi:hypothetical protein
LALVKTLAAEIRRIQAEHAVPDDPASLTDDLLRQKTGSLGITVELAEKPVSCSANLLKTLSRVLSYISVCTATPKDPKNCPRVPA